MNPEQNKKNERFIWHLKQKTKKAIFDFGLIDNSDRIIIGLSGGKDSLALTELLAERQKILSPKFSLIAIHVRLSNMPYQSDSDYLKEFCMQHNVEFHTVETKFEPSNDERKNAKSPCFICSWSRRKTLFEEAKKYGCNKIALGHHQDDILETMLLNMTFHGNIGTMPPKLTMNKFDMTIIRPLCLISEKELMEMSLIRQYAKQKKNCPYEKTSHRNNMKQVLEQLSTLNPHARQNLWAASMNILPEYLPAKIQRHTKQVHL